MFWNRKNRELDEEIQAHLRMAVRDRIERGESPEAARLAALREFGSEALVKEVTRTAWGWSALDHALQDFRFAARMLRKNPGFTAVVALTLALGVGANSAVFSVVRAALAPLPVPHVERVVMAWTENQANKLHQAPASAPDYLAWRSSGIFSSIGAFTEGGFNVRLGDRTERAASCTADRGFFDVLGIPPEVGRFFSDADTQPDAPDAVILSDHFWRAHFAADPQALGKTVVLDGRTYTVIGVVPKAFSIIVDTDVEFYTPLTLDPEMINSPGSRFLGVIARLRPGLGLPAAQQAIRGVEEHQAQQFPANRDNTVALQPIEELAVQDVRALALILMGAVGFVLLIACANIGNLLLARGAARAREMTVRAALGASRWRLTRQLLSESFLLAAGGGILAIVPAVFGIQFILSFKLDALPDASRVRLDWRVLAFNFLLALITGLVFGLLPAWQACKTRIGDALKAAGASHTGARHQRLRSLFIVAEVALTLILMAGAGLMVRSFLGLRSIRPGYDPRGVMTARIELGDTRSSDESITAFFKDLLTQARALPGVTGAAAASSLPSDTDLGRSHLHFPDRPDPVSGGVPQVIQVRVTAGYFDALRIPLVSGRAFQESDVSAAPFVAIVDERAARLYWPNESPLGKRVWIDKKKPGNEPMLRQIVGVVASVALPPAVRNQTGDMGLLYLPAPQAPTPSMAVVVRTAGNPITLAQPLRQIARAIDVDQPLYQVQTIEEAVAVGRASQKLAAWVLGAFGLMALLLSAIGVYGVTAFSVGRRRHEFGIRMSLGARPADVLKLIARQSLWLNACGIAIGLAGAWALTGLTSSLLYGIRATDPATFLAATAFLAAVTMLAAYIPARRATEIDPCETLREE